MSCDFSEIKKSVNGIVSKQKRIFIQNFRKTVWWTKVIIGKVDETILLKSRESIVKSIRSISPKKQILQESGFKIFIHNT